MGREGFWRRSEFQNRFGRRGFDEWRSGIRRRIDAIATASNRFVFRLFRESTGALRVLAGFLEILHFVFIPRPLVPLFRLAEEFRSVGFRLDLMSRADRSRGIRHFLRRPACEKSASGQGQDGAKEKGDPEMPDPPISFVFHETFNGS